LIGLLLGDLGQRPMHRVHRPARVHQHAERGRVAPAKTGYTGRDRGAAEFAPGVGARGDFRIVVLYQDLM
jgi:hypothetical protein